MKRFTISIALIFLSANSFGQIWKQEPNTVFGIPLGKEVELLNLPFCEPRPSQLCIEEQVIKAPTRFYLKGLPAFGSMWVEGSLVAFDGKVASLNLALKQPSFEKMKELLIERYGPPSKIEISDATTIGGAKLKSQLLLWQGKTTEISAIERVGSINDSVVIFSNIELVEKREAARKATVKDNASKF